jgi:signal transduction histidine kinase
MTTLKLKIKRAMGYRLMSCIFLLTLFTIILSVWDIGDILNFKEIELGRLANDLDDYIISQELIKNKQAIDIRFNDENIKNKFNIKWNSGRDNNDGMHYKWPTMWVYTHNIHSVVGDEYGHYKITGSMLYELELVRNFSIRFAMLISFAVMLIWILWPLYDKIPRKLILNPIDDLLNTINTKKNFYANLDEGDNQIEEIEFLKEKIYTLLQDVEAKTLEMAKVDLAKQVAHDIRSPLLALEMISSMSPELPEEKQEMIKNITRKITQIAKSMFDLDCKVSFVHKENLPNHLMLGINLETITKEKEAEYANKNIKFVLNMESTHYTLFIPIAEESFQRSLSNIINNAVESIKGPGEISILTFKGDYEISIQITDNGIGIPKEQLSKIIEKGYSYNKYSGQGLGLSYAKKCFETVGGNIFIESTINFGTVITINLPIRDLPIWLCTQIELSKQEILCILDDDQCIHDLWQLRLSHLSDNIRVLSFYKSNELIAYVKKYGLLNKRFFIDYELIGDELNGLQVISQLNIQKQSTLVTSHDNDEKVISGCLLFDTKILPKKYARIIPIVIL